MDSSKAEALIEKYWNGDTNQVEEIELKEFFSSSEGLSHKDADYFNYVMANSEISPLGKDFDNHILEEIGDSTSRANTKSVFMRYWYVAASFLVLISIGIIFKNAFIKEVPPVQVAQVDTYDDPQKAFEETKKALLFLSSKLNESSDYTSQISKFQKTQEIIKQN